MIKDLKLFNLETLEKLRNERRRIFFGKEGNDKHYLDELEYVLKKKEIDTVFNKEEKEEFVRLEGEDIIGNVYQQNIGTFWHKKTKHVFSYLCIDGEDCGISLHGPHSETSRFVNFPRKIKEIYMFEDGTTAVCEKHEMHDIMNGCTHPIYVLSIKISNDSKTKRD